MRRIVFIESKLPSDIEAFRQVVLRWNKYGDVLQRQERRGAIWLFTPKPLNNCSKTFPEYSHINHFTSVDLRRSRIGRLFALEAEIRNSGSRTTVICGDNQQSLLIGLFLKFRLRSLVGVQIQFHGDTYSFSVNRGLRGLIRVLLSRLGIVFSDSIRIVSNFQRKEISSIWPDASSKFVLAPIPIEITKIANFHSSLKYDLTFIGRLHSERGIIELVDIIKRVKKIRPETSIAIAGKGPMEQFVADELSQWLIDSSVILLGFLSDYEITNLYSKTRVLISTAPREGYGLTLREAILSNVPVIARKSDGALETKSAYPDGIDTYTTNKEAVERILIKFDENAQKQDVHLLETQIESDENSIKKLTNVWLTL